MNMNRVEQHGSYYENIFICIMLMEI